MVIDLHTHSKLSLRNGDSVKLESNFEALKILKRNKVKIAAFSDHNYFLASSYVETKMMAKKMDILFFPAVELDVVRNNDETGNIIIIFDNKLSLSKLKKLEMIIKNETGKRKIRIKKIAKLLREFEKIIVPHVGKSDFCTFEDLSSIKFDAIEVSNLQHKNYLSFQRKMKKNNKSTSVVAWSDTHIWSRYPQIKNLYTFIDGIYSFSDLKKALNENKNYVRER